MNHYNTPGAVAIARIQIGKLYKDNHNRERWISLLEREYPITMVGDDMCIEMPHGPLYFQDIKEHSNINISQLGDGEIIRIKIDILPNETRRG